MLFILTPDPKHLSMAYTGFYGTEKTGILDAHFLDEENGGIKLKPLEICFYARNFPPIEGTFVAGWW